MTLPQFLDIELIPVDACKLDERYQREKTVVAGKIADGYDSNQMTPILASKRNGKGIYHVIDGQQRTIAFRKLGFTEIPAQVVKFSDPKEEALLYIAVNTNSKEITALERFKAAVFAEEPDAVAIVEILKKSGGWVIAKRNSAAASTVIGAVASVEGIYRFGPDALRGSMALLHELWDDREGVWLGDFITAWGEFLRGIRGDLSDEAKERLAKLSPAQIIRDSLSYREAALGGRGSRSAAIVAFLRKRVGITHPARAAHCPKCDAAVGEPCRSESGKAVRHHDVRVELLTL